VSSSWSTSGALSGSSLVPLAAVPEHALLVFSTLPLCSFYSMSRAVKQDQPLWGLARAGQMLIRLCGIRQGERAAYSAVFAGRRSPVVEQDRELSTAGVWWLPYGTALAGSCEAIAEACDSALAHATTVDHALPDDAHDGVSGSLECLSLNTDRCP